jgi:hypothetical protein
MTTTPQQQPTHTPWSIGCIRTSKLEQIVIQSQETKAEVCRLPALSRMDGAVNVRAGEIAANAQRIVACVNSLAGIPDPAAALTQAREALEHAELVAQTREHKAIYTAALAALEGRAQP